MFFQKTVEGKFGTKPSLKNKFNFNPSQRYPNNELVNPFIFCFWTKPELIFIPIPYFPAAKYQQSKNDVRHQPKRCAFSDYYDQEWQITGIKLHYQGAFWDNRLPVITGKNYSSPTSNDYHTEIQIKYDYIALNASIPAPTANLSQFTIIAIPLITHLTIHIRDNSLRRRTDRYNTRPSL